MYLTKSKTLIPQTNKKKSTKRFISEKKKWQYTNTITQIHSTLTQPPTHTHTYKYSLFHLLFPNFGLIQIFYTESNYTMLKTTCCVFVRVNMCSTMRREQNWQPLLTTIILCFLCRLYSIFNLKICWYFKGKIMVFRSQFVFFLSNKFRYNSFILFDLYFIWKLSS